MCDSHFTEGTQEDPQLRANKVTFQILHSFLPVLLPPAKQSCSWMYHCVQLLPSPSHLLHTTETFEDVELPPKVREPLWENLFREA